MGEPLKQDDDQERKFFTAQDRANERWGIGEDQERAMPVENEDESRSARERADERWGTNSEELKSLESNADDGFGGRAESDEQESLASSTLWNNSDGNKKGKIRGFLRGKKKKATLGLVGALAGGGLLVSTLMGPALIINQLREMMLDVGSIQNSQSLRYRRKNIHKIGDMFTKDGRRGGKIIADMERSGYQFRFDRQTGEMTEIINPRGQQIAGDAIAVHLSDYVEVAHPLRTSKWKTKRMEAFYGRYKVSRVSPVVRVDGDPEDPDRAVNRRVFAEVNDGEVDTTLRGGLDESDENLTDEERTARAQQNAEHEALTRNEPTFDDIANQLEEGVPIEELTEEQRLLLRASSGIDQDVANLMDNIGKNTSMFGTIRNLFSSTDLADKVCTVQNRMAGVEAAARNYRALGMLRYATTFIKAGDKSRASSISSGNIDPGMFNALMKRVTAVDANGNGLGASPGFAYMAKKKFSKSDNEAFKGNYGVDGKLSGSQKTIKDATDRVPGINPRSCGVIQNPVTQIGVAVVELGAGIFTGGASAAATQGAKTTVTTAFKNGIKRILTKQLARSLATGVALEISFEGIMALTQSYAEKSMAVNFTGQEKGGELGYILAGGAGTLNKQRSLHAGMVPATAEQYAQSQTTMLAEKAAERENQSFATRMFDYNNHDSLVFKAATHATTLPTTPDGVLASMANSISSFPNLISTMFGSIFINFMPSTDAQSTDEVSYDTLEVKGKTLATDPVGNLLPIIRPDIEAIDPISNRDELIAANHINETSYEPLSDVFLDHMKNCVEGVDTLTVIENHSDGDVATDCLAQENLTKKFKAHLLYLDMLDGIDAALFPEEIGDASVSAPAPSTTTPTVGNTVDTSCAQGTVDLGPTEGYKNGEKYSIRLCGIPNIPSSGREDTGGIARVNSTASSQWLNLGTEAAASGIQLRAASSFRSNEEQTRLYGCYRSGTCNNGNVAALPGRSNHQFGFAIDIDITAGKDPSLTQCQANPGRYPVYQWLAANSAKHGISANVTSECWHWSIGGN